MVVKERYIICFISLFFLVLLFLPGCAHREEMKREASTRLGIGVGYLGEGKPSLALKELLKAEKLDGSDPRIKNALGLTYMALGDLKKAEEYFREAIELRDDYSEAYNNLGLLLSREGRSEDAIKAYEKAVENLLYQTPERAYNNMGIEYEKLGRLEEAKNAYLRAISLSPQFPAPYYNLGRLYSRQGRLDRAVEYLEKAVSLNPGFVSAYYQLGEVYLERKEYDKALESFKKVVKLSKTEEVREMARKYIELLER